MKIQILRAVARRPLLALSVCLVALVLAVGTAVSAARTACRGRDSLVAANAEAWAGLEESSGRAILGRLWFDQWPEGPTTKVHLLLFLAGGFGFHEEGASYKFAMEFFEFERFGKRLDASFLSDGEKRDVKFKVEGCSDLPPFDACLRLEDAFRGPRTYYGFASEEELTRRLPWAHGEMALAKARAASR